MSQMTPGTNFLPLSSPPGWSSSLGGKDDPDDLFGRCLGIWEIIWEIIWQVIWEIIWEIWEIIWEIIWETVGEIIWKITDRYVT